MLPLQIRVLNSAESSSTSEVFRSWAKRLEEPLNPLLSNDDDPELLIHVPFTGNVKIKAISVMGGSEDTGPSALRVYVNREDIDFAAVSDLPPAQSWDLQPNMQGDLEYPTQ